jgi:ornithine cyclodeaminase/alanine dehydrogenase-like protein (mu-crystallin family)
MRIVEEDEVRRRLTMAQCIDLMRETFEALENGKAAQPPRAIGRLPRGRMIGFMPACLEDGGCLGAKIITSFPDNAGTSYPSHMGYVLVFEAQHGSFIGMADCTAIAEIRTGAASGVATDLLARPDAHVLAIIGAGAQGRSHLAAMLQVRPRIDEVRVFDVREEAARLYARRMSELHGIPVRTCASAREAVEGADIICTLTPSVEPFLTREWVKPGAHVNAVGTFTPTTREVCSDLIAASRLYADEVGALRRESGEYLIPLEEGLIGEDHIVGSIGQVLLGTAPGRTDDEQITVFDALGQATEDLMCARFLVCDDADGQSENGR